jgi:predicted transcriptional regulator
MRSSGWKPFKDRANERAKEALALRREGLTYKKVGEQYGITRQAAMQYVRLGEMLEKKEEFGVHDLPMKIICALERDGIREITPSNVSKSYTLQKLYRVPGLGFKTIEILQEWLRKHGEVPCK